MRRLRRKLLFLELTLAYVVLLLALTGSGEKKAASQAASRMQTGDQKSASEPMEATAGQSDPYRELKKKVALTFDDGPHPDYTPKLLDGLKERGAHATFFVMGKQAEQYPELIERMAEEGHLIGNHTYSHLQLKKSNREEFKAELTKTSDIVKDITGKELQYVRPPYGTWEKAFETELNMFPVLWTIDPLDWCKNDAACIVQNVLSKVQEDAVILMHDQYDSSVKAALQIVDTLQKEGYEFVTVDQLVED